MSRTKSGNFAFLADQDPLLHEIGASAESLFHTDPNATLVKLRQLAEHLARNAAAQLGVSFDRETKFFDLIASMRSRIAIDDKVLRLLHHIRKMGNEAAHEYKQDRTEAGKALRSAREVCIWYYRTFCHPDSNFLPGPFVRPVDWKQEEVDRREEIARLKMELEEGRRNSANSEELVRTLRQREEELRASVEERTRDAEASFELAEEQSRKLETLAAKYEERLNDIARRKSADANAAEIISERSRRASEHVQAEWAPEIRLQDAFQDYVLTANQKSLVLELESFLSAPEEHVFVLSGHAGTGKTFITKGLSEFLQVAGRNCAMVAPTGKAARVITQKSGRPATTIHKKIYSMDDVREYKVDDVDGSETYKLYAELEVNDDADNTVYIVDEASMVSDVYSEGEFFRFGSGRLLSDLMKYVNLDHNDHTKKVIFIGDAAQLPPVGMSFSPALDRKYLAKTFGIGSSRQFELSQVVRQDAGSAILSSANTLREALSKRSFNKLSLSLVEPAVHVCDGIDALVSGYLIASGNKVNDVAMIIASSNADVASFNEQVRRSLFPGEESISKGDKLVVVMNCVVAGTSLNNGDLVYVTQVEQSPEIRSVTLRNKNRSSGKVEETEVTLQFRDLQIAFRTPSGEVIRAAVKIVESLLYSSHPNLSSDETKALYIDFKRRNPQLPKHGKVLRDTLREDPYFNALRVKFGYSLTCHKAQGSEWPDVFVQCRTYMEPRTEGYFRWLYTAITRASNRLHLLNPPDLSPWDKPVGIPVPTGPGAPTATRPVREQPSNGSSPWVSDSAAETDGTALDEAGSTDSTGDAVLDGIHNEVSIRISEMPGVKIESVEHHAWQVAFYVTDGKAFSRINVAYNSRGVVSSVMPVPRDGLGSAVASRLADLQGFRFVDQATSKAEVPQFTRDVFNDFFPVFSEKAALNGLRILGATEEQWNLRVVLGNDNVSGEVAIYCDGKGRITKYSWVGRPPQDQSLHQSLEATMANL
jgi:hypothetical protein